ncbi:MAG: hypothetical protein JKY56_11185 [Kofleriaceae bacterium]|nr:hypothetical protein [Kofleriaceae bacterium]
MRPRIRPTFSIDIADKTNWLACLKEELTAKDAPCTGVCFRRHAKRQVPKFARHFWSPVLNIEIREEEGESSLHGRFSPEPNIWTGFMAMYGVLVMVALVGSVVGLSQLSLGSLPWGLYLVPASLIMGAFIYGAAFIGQGLSAEQMYEMRSFVDDVVKACPAEDANA